MKYQCNNCGAQSLMWEGKCSSCNEWGTYEELAETESSTKSSKSSASHNNSLQTKPAEKLVISEFYNSKKKKGAKAKVDSHSRISTGFSEFDRVLGGGIVEGEVILLSGEPGIGKSTILLQLSDLLSKGKKVLYVSGEESSAQFANRYDRLVGITESSKLEVTTEIDTDAIASMIENEGYDMVVIDSIQSLQSPRSRGYPGSISQVRISGQTLMRAAKDNNTAILIVGQINKEGSIAGPKVLEHLVDCVLYMEGEKFNAFRILRSMKNRFGPTNEIGVFEMTGGGMVEVTNPSEVFLQSDGNASGSVVSATLQGSRVVFIEVQALCVERDGGAGPMRRVANGIKKSRLEMLCAVLSKRGGVFLGDKDVFVNVVGGLNIADPAVDLAVVAAIKSSVKDNPVSNKKVFVGEIGLTGEIRKTVGRDLVEKEGKRLGYEVVTGVRYVGKV